MAPNGHSEFNITEHCGGSGQGHGQLWPEEWSGG